MILAITNWFWQQIPTPKENDPSSVLWLVFVTFSTIAAALTDISLIKLILHYAQ